MRHYIFLLLLIAFTGAIHSMDVRLEVAASSDLDETTPLKMSRNRERRVYEDVPEQINDQVEREREEAVKKALLVSFGLVYLVFGWDYTLNKILGI